MQFITISNLYCVLFLTFISPAWSDNLTNPLVLCDQHLVFTEPLLHSKHVKGLWIKMSLSRLFK